MQDVPTESADETFAAARARAARPGALGRDDAVDAARAELARDLRSPCGAEGRARRDDGGHDDRAPVDAHRAARRHVLRAGEGRGGSRAAEDRRRRRGALWSAPAAVATFLAFALGDPASAEAPTYASAILDERAADAPVIYAARRLRGVETRSIGGEQILVRSRDGGEVLSRNAEAIAAKLRKEPSAVFTRHRGHLTRQRGDAPQAFGVTVAASKVLDATNQAFGRVVRDNNNLIDRRQHAQRTTPWTLSAPLDRRAWGSGALPRAEGRLPRRGRGLRRRPRVENLPREAARRVEITRVELL